MSKVAQLYPNYNRSCNIIFRLQSIIIIMTMYNDQMPQECHDGYIFPKKKKSILLFDPVKAFILILTYITHRADVTIVSSESRRFRDPVGVGCDLE